MDSCPFRLVSAKPVLEHRLHRLPIIGVLACGLAFAGPAAEESPSDANARYQQDRAFCNSGESYQDRTSCLREAGAARVETRKGRLDEDQGDYHANALARCNPLPADERDACRRRIEGEGTVSGSVYAGGLLRELVVPDLGR